MPREVNKTSWKETVMNNGCVVAVRVNVDMSMRSPGIEFDLKKIV